MTDQTDTTVRAAVLSVGSELLLGHLTDTNATWLSRQLSSLGVEVVHHLAVGDDIDEIVASLHWLAASVDVIIAGGGLGPTSDDLTREAAAKAAGVSLEQRDDLVDALTQRFASMGREMPEQNLKQARIPEGSRPVAAVGTAPGFILDFDAPKPTRLIALPGVPWELRELFERDVIEEIRTLAGARTTVTRSVHVAGMGESDVASVVEPLVTGQEGITLAFLAHTTGIEVRLTVTASDGAHARAVSQPIVDAVVDALGPAVAGIDDETLEAAVIRLLRERSEHVAVAESMSGGGISARLTSIPGASDVFDGGAVVYANAAKRQLLDVEVGSSPRDAVGDEITSQLASAVRDRTGAQWGLAVTGVAGPGDLDDVAQGNAWWALTHPDGSTEVHTRRFVGDRTAVMSRVATAAIELLRRRLAGY